MNDRQLQEGWYQMSAHDLEIELRRWRGQPAEASNAQRLTSEEAIAIRDQGNIPDELDRSLRLVLIVGSTEELLALDDKRLRYEPDAHEAPGWKRAGSRPINVVPLRREDVEPRSLARWSDDPDMAELEEGWERTGRVRGIRVAAEVRGFVYKTVVALERAGRQVTIDAIADSLTRWLGPEDVARVRAGLSDD